MITTNISGSKPFPLTYDLFYKATDKKMNGRKTGDKLEDDTKKDTSVDKSFPFFTYNVEISSKKIDELPKDQIIDYFFNKNKFLKILNQLKIATSPDEKHAMGNANMTLMLNTLFCTSFPTVGNITNTYNTLIRGDIVNTNSTKGSFSIIPDFLKTTPMKFSYLTLYGSIYTVTRVTWLNDILNDIEFSILFNRLAILNDWLNKKIDQLKDEINKNKSDFDKIQVDFIKAVKSDAQFQSRINSDLDTIRMWFNRYKGSISVTYSQIKTAIDKLLSLINTQGSQPSLFNSILEIFNLNLLKPPTVYATEIIPLILVKNQYFNDLLRSIEKIKMDEETIQYFETPTKYFDLIDLKNRKKMTKQQDELFRHLGIYSEFTTIFQLIEPFTSRQKTVTNPVLQDIFSSFLKKNPEILKLSSYVESLRKLQNMNESEYSNLEALESGIVTKLPKNNYESDSYKKKQSRNIFDIQSKEQYQVFVALDLVKGMLNKDTINEIRCVYKDFRLSSLYKDIRDDLKKNKSKLYRPQEMVNLKVLEQKKTNIKYLKKGGFQTQKQKQTQTKNPPKKNYKGTRRKPVKKGNIDNSIKPNNGVYTPLSSY